MARNRIFALDDVIDQQRQTQRKSVLTDRDHHGEQSGVFQRIAKAGAGKNLFVVVKADEFDVGVDAVPRGKAVIKAGYRRHDQKYRKQDERRRNEQKRRCIKFSFLLQHGAVPPFQRVVADFGRRKGAPPIGKCAPVSLRLLPPYSTPRPVVGLKLWSATFQVFCSSEEAEATSREP